MAKPKTSKQNLATSLKAKIMPAPGYILIEPESVETKTASGLYLPENATNEKPQKGKVIAIGEAELTDKGEKKNATANTGDTVVYKKWGGNDYKQDGKDYLFVKFEDIMAVIK